jgi:hypothetical protein
VPNTSRDPLAKAAYNELVRAWLTLAVSAEQSVKYPPRKTTTGERALAAIAFVSRPAEASGYMGWT